MTANTLASKPKNRPYTTKERTRRRKPVGQDEVYAALMPHCDAGEGADATPTGRVRRIGADQGETTHDQG